ncbi:MAG: hypothetical protein ABR556_06505 [Pyrinomonadaceae bacterium]
MTKNAIGIVIATANDGIPDRLEIKRRAFAVGYNEGFREGQEDRRDGRRSGLNDFQVYRDATLGYRNDFGDIELYKQSFRSGFRRGYEDGFRGRQARPAGQNGRGIGDILGDIFGRP